MKRITSAAAVTAAAALALAGCGGGSNGNSASPGSSTSSVSAPTSAGSSPSASGGGSQLPNLKGQTLEVAATWSGDEQKAFQQVLKPFEQATGATVKYTSTGDDIATVLGTRIQGGSPPDVALIPQPGLIQQFVAQGAVKPVPDFAKQELQQNYAPVWTKLGTFNGQVYAVYFKAADKSTVWYKTSDWQNAGISGDPKSWDDFTKDLKTLQDSGVANPLSIGAGDGWVLTDWFENVYLSQAGPDKYEALTQHKIKWTDPSVVQALTTLADLFKQKDLIIPNALQTSFNDSVIKVFSGKASVVYEGDFVAGVISGNTKAKVGSDAKFFPFPAAGSTSSFVIGGGDAAVMMKDNPGAEALMAYLANPAAPDVWVKIGGFTSPNKKVPTSDYPDDTSRQIAQAVTNAQTFEFDMSDQTPSQFGGTPGKGEWKILQDFFANPSNPQQTAQQLEQAAAAAYKS